MRFAPRVFFLILGVTLLAGPASAQPEGWHGSLEDGIEAAAKSNKPILLITAWKRTL